MKLGQFLSTLSFTSVLVNSVFSASIRRAEFESTLMQRNSKSHDAQPSLMRRIDEIMEDKDEQDSDKMPKHKRPNKNKNKHGKHNKDEEPKSNLEKPKDHGEEHGDKTKHNRNKEEDEDEDDKNPEPIHDKDTQEKKPGSNKDKEKPKDKEGEESNQPSKDVGGSETKKVKFTYYWLAIEDEFPKGNEKDVPDCETKKSLAKVSSAYWKSLHLEGSGLLSDGTYLNCGDKDCECFTKSKPIGSKGDPLQIYSSLAIVEKNYKEGTIIYIKNFDGLKLPNGKTHNGCFKAIDSSWSFGANQIDMYVESKKNYETIQKTFGGDYVDATYNAKCQVLNYSN